MNRDRDRPRRIVVADPQPIVRLGIGRLLEGAGMEVSEAVADPPEALKAAIEGRPDLVLTELAFHNGESGLHLIRRIRDQVGALPVLVFSDRDETLYAERALRAGSSGYVMKGAPLPELLQAIRRVAEGELHVSDRIRGSLVQRVARGGRAEHPLGVLTDRELEVFHLLGHGRTTREVAEALSLSVKTIDTHRGKIMRKLDLAGPNDLLYRAIAWVQFGDPGGEAPGG